MDTNLNPRPEKAAYPAPQPSASLPARSRAVTALAIVAGLLALMGAIAAIFLTGPDYVDDQDVDREQVSSASY